MAHSVTLTADVTCTMSSGIIVGKSGTTINLNGHTMTGPTSGTGAKGASNHATGNGQQNCYRVRCCS